MIALALAGSLLAAPLLADLSAGPTYLPAARSSAIGHSVKPGVRLGLRVEALPRLELGAALGALLEGNAHYRVLGLLAHGRWALYETAARGFGVGIGLGVGAGHDADILHEDLAADGRVRVYGLAVLDARWLLARRWLLGVEAAWEHLRIARLGLLAGVRWP